MWPQLFLIESNLPLTFKALAGQGNDSLKEFDLLAYTGGKVELGIRHPVIFDLSSTKSAPTVPLLADHDPKIIVGHTKDIKLSNSDIKATGVMSGLNDKTKEILSTSGNGFPWQLSVGIVSSQLDHIKQNERYSVNNLTDVGPIYVARKNLLREISFLSLGADPNTLAVLRAKFYKGATMMSFNDWVVSLSFDPSTLTPEQLAALQTVYDDYVTDEQSEPDATQVAARMAIAAKIAKSLVAKLAKKTPIPAVPPTVPPVTLPNIDDHLNHFRLSHVQESERIDSIKKLEAKYGNPKTKEGKYISNLAISDGWTVEKSHLEMLQAARPNTRSDPSNDGPGGMRILEAAACQAGRLDRADLEKRYDPKLLDEAHKRFKSRISLQQVLIEAAVANGYDGPQNNIRANLRAILQAAFSTIDIGGILSNIINVYLLKGYMNVDQSWREIAAITTANDFKVFTSYRAVGGFTFEKLAPDGKIPHGTMSQQAFLNQVATYAKMFAITRQDIYNDNLGALTDVPKQIGRGGAIGLNIAFWTTFMNNSAFFVAGNNNVTAGALSIAGLTTANTAFRKLKDPQGNFIQATVKLVLVPPELEPTANQLYTSQNLAGTASPLGPTDNPVRGKYPPVVSPYLSDPTIPGNSTTAYYLLADPNDVPAVQVAFLDGIETPTVETSDVDFTQLGIQTRGYWDWGVALQDPNAGIRSTGV